MTTYYLNDPSINWQVSASTIQTKQNQNLTLDASNSLIRLSRNGVVNASFDTSFNFTNLPNCSAAPTLGSQLTNKTYVDSFYYSNAATFNSSSYTLSTTFICGNSVSLVIPSTWQTFDIEIVASSFYGLINTNNAAYIHLRYGINQPTNGSTTVPAATVDLYSNTLVIANNNTGTNGIGDKGDVIFLQRNANTAITPGTTYYYSVWGRMVNPASVTYGEHYIYVKAFRKS